MRDTSCDIWSIFGITACGNVACHFYAMATGRRLLLTDLLLVLFGISSWLAVNGIWVELPLLVAALPEGWTLPSYLSVIVQLANVGPLLYTLLRYRLLRRSTRLDSLVVYGMLVTGAAACFLSALFWQRTSTVAGVEHSTALFVLLFFIALVDCTSSVVYVPFTARFGSRYLVSYMVGEGLSGLLPSLVALAQGVGGNAECVNSSAGINGTFLTPAPLKPRFPVAGFFYFLFAMMALSCVAFALLLHLPRLEASRERGSPPSSDASDASPRGGSPTRLYAVEAPAPAPAAPVWRWRSLLPLLVLQALISLLANGFLPSVQSYSVLPYGNLAFHLVATLSLMANPAACLLLFLLPVRRAAVAAGCALLGGLCAVYLLLTAAESPAPPLQGTAAGEALVVLGWVLFVGLTTYAKVGIAGLLRPWGGSALFWYGAATQAGSLVGAVAAFLAVNVFNLFTGYYPC
ncbi:solute carrier family 52, riboflavin transporter, member 3-A-like isoform X3 [Pollicipes pollicipes]|uniref:solute carrier family 52, riboflavin transporter, member 3-A-like isoform X3 n=1 Tax=Pollicipes pollicipes TaxID=41117 RepID=UPI0018851AD6|nr:solute carrier family 52, riboflavin transporter, member 3-A-like isoform X3 [Pollicipes pollicipes]